MPRRWWLTWWRQLRWRQLRWRQVPGTAHIANEAAVLSTAPLVGAEIVNERAYPRVVLAWFNIRHGIAVVHREHPVVAALVIDTNRWWRENIGARRVGERKALVVVLVPIVVIGPLKPVARVGHLGAWERVAACLLLGQASKHAL